MKGTVPHGEGRYLLFPTLSPIPYLYSNSSSLPASGPWKCCCAAAKRRHCVSHSKLGLSCNWYSTPSLLSMSTVRRSQAIVLHMHILNYWADPWTSLPPPRISPQVASPSNLSQSLFATTLSHNRSVRCACCTVGSAIASERSPPWRCVPQCFLLAQYASQNVARRAGVGYSHRPYTGQILSGSLYSSLL